MFVVVRDLFVSVLAGCGSDDAKRDSGKSSFRKRSIHHKKKERLSWNHKF